MSAYPEIIDEVGQPRGLKHIARGTFLDSVHIPPINAVHAGKRLPAPYYLRFLQKV